MGEVYRARDTRLERPVAIKILSSNVQTDEHLRLRFEREAKTISSINHPNICSLYDLGHDAGVDYVVMELIDGESLEDRLKEGPLPIAEVCSIGAQIADAIGAAHERNVVHRDVKPGNIMLAKRGAKLLDFGIAKATAAGPDKETQKALTAVGFNPGTPAYESPEQIRGEEVDGRSDIFSLGTVLYEMSTGRRPFDTKAEILEREPAPMTTALPTIPPELEQVVRQCLRKNREERWQDAGDVATELRRMLEPQSASGIHTARSAPTRQAAVIFAVVVAIGIVLGSVTLWYTTRSKTIPIKLPAEYSVMSNSANLAISPNGRLIAYVAGLNRQLYIQRVDAGIATALEDADEVSGVPPVFVPFDMRVGLAMEA